MYDYHSAGGCFGRPVFKLSGGFFGIHLERKENSNLTHVVHSETVKTVCRKQYKDPDEVRNMAAPFSYHTHFEILPFLCKNRFSLYDEMKN